MSLDNVSKSGVSSSLLDILIKSEEPIEEPDPLDAIGNIGDEVIDQLSGAMESNQDLMQNALKMFDDVMAYSKKPTINCSQPGRKQSRHQRSASPLPLPSSYASPNVESTVKMFHKRDMKAGFNPRTKFESACSELYQHGNISDSQFHLLHEKLEKDRSQQFEDLVNKDVERLLTSASRIYGPREWTVEEKTEFANYCRNLRSGTLSDEDKESVQNFYAKAYQASSIGTDQEDVKDMLATRSAIFFPKQLRELEKNSSKDVKQEEFEMKDVKPEKFELEDVNEEEFELRDVKEVEEEMEEDELRTYNLPAISLFKFQNSLDPAQIGNFDPGMKYEKEKEFRITANRIFANIVNERIRQQASFSKRNDSFAIEMREKGLQEDLVTLSIKLNQFMKDEDKQWSTIEKMQLRGYLEMYREKMHFTIVQTKDFGMFLRKTYGRLQQYEIERENDTALQEKRKYWQAYKKTHAPVKKEKEVKSHSTRPYIKRNVDTKGESAEAKKLRKAAYLRQWRLAQKEKQFYANMFGSIVTKPGGPS